MVQLGSLIEARTLSRVSQNNPSEHHLVWMLETFQLQGRLIVAMEDLDLDIEAFMVQQSPEPARMSEIATVLRQLFRALRKLEELDIVHLDIKPDNIMFGNVAAHGLSQLKLVDFSCAKSVRAAAQSTRAEVALGQGASGAADVWSVGCVAAELATARPLYPARSDAQLLGAVCRTHGALPAALLERPGRTATFFRRSEGGGWALRECPSVEGCPSVPSFGHVGTEHVRMLNLEADGRYAVQVLHFRQLLIRNAPRLRDAPALPRSQRRAAAGRSVPHARRAPCRAAGAAWAPSRRASERRGVATRSD